MSELLDLAEAVVGRAVPGEQVEVYVARGHDTEVRAYDGAVESLSSATSGGVGIRVVLAGEGDDDGNRVGLRVGRVARRGRRRRDAGRGP